MKSRLRFGLSIVAIFATTAVANAAHAPKTTSHQPKAHGGESSQRPRLTGVSGAGPITGSIPVGAVATGDCYGAGGGVLPGTTVSLPAPASDPGMTPRAGAKDGGRNVSTSPNDSHSGRGHSALAGSARTNPSPLANGLMNTVGSNAGTLNRDGKWKRAALSTTYLLDGFATLPGVTPPCATPPGATPPNVVPSDAGTNTSAGVGTDTGTDADMEITTETAPVDPTLPAWYPPGFPPTGWNPPGWNPPGWNPPDSPLPDPFFLDPPPVELVSLYVAATETAFREPLSATQASPSAVPEPGSWGLLAIGLGAWAGVRRRRGVA